MSDSTDDLTHYMEATARMRERAEKAEAEAARLRALILDYGQAVTPGELLDAMQALHDEVTGWVANHKS
jgi:hypothetical protein